MYNYIYKTKNMYILYVYYSPNTIYKNVYYSQDLYQINLTIASIDWVVGGLAVVGVTSHIGIDWSAANKTCTIFTYIHYLTIN